MSKKRKRRDTAGRSNARSEQSPSSTADMAVNPTPAASTVVFVIGAIALLVATAAAGTLVVEHLGGIAVPGCGDGGPCQEAAKSIWGKVPLVNWPVSNLGLAYFAAMLIAWLVGRGRLSGAVVRCGLFGGLISLFYMGVVLIAKLHCPYCIASHIANFVFCALLILGRRSAVGGAGLVIPAGVFLATTAFLAGAEYNVAQRVEAEREKSTQEIIERSRANQNDNASDTPPANANLNASSGADANANGTTAIGNANMNGAAPSPPTVDEPEPFTGRWLLGPKKCPVRIVMFTDYQCPDCRIFEGQVMDIVQGRSDVSLSVKHFPFCTDCNPYAGRTLHPNACWAARAAETAGLLYGNEGFWKMHRWLFSIEGRFETTEFLNDGISGLGLDPTGFAARMMQPERLDLVKEDIEEAFALGIERTPMIFINGVEFKGWHTSDALKRTVDQLIASDLPARTAAADQPQSALNRWVEKWRSQSQRRIPPLRDAFSFGTPGEKPEVLMWGDFREPYTQIADKHIRDFLAANGGHYTFRHYPFDKSCNTFLQVDTRHPLACFAARLAEAAAQLGGVDAYLAMHDWLFKNREAPIDGMLDEAAALIGVDTATLQQTMAGPEVREAVQADMAVTRQLRMRGIPFMFINGKYLQRTHHGEVSIIDGVLTAANEGE